MLGGVFCVSATLPTNEGRRMADKLRLEVKDNVVDGKKFPPEVITLTRKR
jgi:hypothetical protein